MDDWRTVLKSEFASEPGSFSIQLRTDLVWDKQTFSRMTAAMLECCQAYDRQTKPDDPMEPDETSLPRWIAEGFWYFSFWVRDWTTHPAWATKTASEQAYYEAAYERLYDLAYWLFFGESPYTSGALAFTPM